MIREDAMACGSPLPLFHPAALCGGQCPRFSDAREYPLISDAGFSWNTARDDKALEGQRTPYHVACGRPLPLSTPQPSAVVSAPGFPMHGSIP